MSQDGKNKHPELSPLKEAAKETPNVVGLAAAAALSMATLNPVPILVGMVAEAAYLLAVPDSSWYGQLLARRKKVLDAKAAMDARDSQKKSIIPLLPDNLAERYKNLERAKILLEKDLPADDAFYGDILQRLDHLLDSFLSFAQKDCQFRSYLLNLGTQMRSVSQSTRKGKNDPPGTEKWVKALVDDIDASYTAEQASLQEQIDKEDDAEPVLRKRLEVLHRRSEYLKKIGTTLINLQHQMALLEDTFGLISDEIRARSPKEVLTDVDEVVMQTNLMNDLLEKFGDLGS
jgi:hypothetical protein